MADEESELNMLRVSNYLYSLTAFPLLSLSGAYLILKLLSAVFKTVMHLHQSKRNYPREVSKLCNIFFPNNNK